MSYTAVLSINWMSGNKDKQDLTNQVETLRSIKEQKKVQRLPQYQALYEQNTDFMGWLTIVGTRIDYPVMYTPYDEEYYLYRDFEKQENENGTLFIDTDSQVGNETQQASTNIIIHGHHMKSGEMFGELDLFQNPDYYEEHKVIKFDTLYEEREYEVISVFLSQVYKKSEDVFKYYKFFEAEDEEAFNTFYNNIKALALYDTGVDAVYGDEFITLSTCAYHVENGRLVVVAKRIK